jgi:hypothetical protein
MLPIQAASSIVGYEITSCTASLERELMRLLEEEK